MNPNGIRGQTALVTGASSGIGLALAKLLVRDGCHVILVARNTDKLHQIAAGLQQHEVDVHVMPADLADTTAPARLLGLLGDAGLQVDVLVNSAGVGAHGAVAKLDRDRQLQMIQLNVVALFCCAQTDPSSQWWLGWSAEEGR